MEKRSSFIKTISGSPIKEANDRAELPTFNLAFYKDNVYLKTKSLSILKISGLLSMENSSFTWSKVSNIPFTERTGQSVTPIDKGLLFFGGEDFAKIIFDDMWLFDGTTWSYIATALPPLAYHSVCFDGKNKIIVNGGIISKGDKCVYSPTNTFYTIDVNTAELEKIEVETPETFPKTLFSHSMNIMSNGNICLFGGKDGDGRVSNKLFEVDLKNKKVEERKTPFGVFSYEHQSSIMYNMLFVTGGKNNYEQYNMSLWCYNFDHSLWFEVQTQMQNGCFSFMSQALTTLNSIHIISRDLNKLLTLPVLRSSSTSNDFMNNQEFIKFFSAHLSKTIKDFSVSFISREPSQNVKLLKKKISEIAAEKNIPFDKIEKCIRVQEENDQLTKLMFRSNSMHSSFNIQHEEKEDSKTPNFVDPREIYTKIRTFNEQKTKEKTSLLKEVENAERTADRLSFGYLVENIVKDPESKVTVDELQLKVRHCRQLSQIIESMRKKNEERRKEYEQCKKNIKSNKISTYILINQMCSALQQLSNTRANTHQIKEQCIKLCKEILENRISILNNNKAKQSAEIQQILQEVEAPALNEYVKWCTSVKSHLKDEIKRKEASLFTSNSSNDKLKLDELLYAIEDVGGWMTACSSSFPELPPPNISFGSSHAKRFANKKNDTFTKTLTRWDALDSELQRIADKIVL